MKNSLYQISTEISQIIDEVVRMEGEVTPENEARIAELNTMMFDKTDGIVAWVNSQEDLIAAGKARADEIADFINTVQKRIDRFDRYVDACLSVAGTNKIEGKLYSISKRKPSQVVTITDETLIPMDYIKIPEPKPTIQKAEIAKALKAGEEVPGARLEDSKTITISYKLK